ncbi:MAG: hypothetical protein ACFFC3_03905 [Candidatus Odinarchaeota archaeon]
MPIKIYVLISDILRLGMDLRGLRNKINTTEDNDIFKLQVNSKEILS